MPLATGSERVLQTCDTSVLKLPSFNFTSPPLLWQWQSVSLFSHSPTALRIWYERRRCVCQPQTWTSEDSVTQAEEGRREGERGGGGVVVRRKRAQPQTWDNMKKWWDSYIKNHSVTSWSWPNPTLTRPSGCKEAICLETGHAGESWCVQMCAASLTTQLSSAALHS